MTLTPELETNILATLSSQPLVDGTMLKQIADSLSLNLRETTRLVASLYLDGKYKPDMTEKARFETLFSRISMVGTRDPHPRFVLPGDLLNGKDI